MWVRYVTESVHASGAWQLSSWINNAGSHSRRPTTRDLRYFFNDGKDWRRATFE